jgi:hypothetical protein
MYTTSQEAKESGKYSRMELAFKDGTAPGASVTIRVTNHRWVRRNP